MKLVKKINGLEIIQITKRDTERDSEFFSLTPGDYAVFDRENGIIEISDSNLNCCIEFAECYNDK